jgi:hypothetical protein
MRFAEKWRSSPAAGGLLFVPAHDIEPRLTVSRRIINAIVQVPDAHVAVRFVAVINLRFRIINMFSPHGVPMDQTTVSFFKIQSSQEEDGPYLLSAISYSNNISSFRPSRLGEREGCVTIFLSESLK